MRIAKLFQGKRKYHRAVFSFLLLSLMFGLLSSLSLNAADQDIKNRPWYRFLENTDLKTGPLPVVQQSKIEGVDIYFLPDNFLPMASVSIYFLGGAHEETPSNAGITRYWGESVVLSGSDQWPRDRLASFFEKRGSKLYFENSIERTSFSVNSLSAYLMEDLKTMIQVIKSPHFKMSDIKVLEKTFLQEIDSREENPMEIASIIKSRKLYPNGIRSLLKSKKSVKSIRQNDLFEWHKKMINKGRMSIVMSGDIRLSEVTPILKKFILSLKDGNHKPDTSNLRQAMKKADGKIAFGKKEIPQTTIMLTAPGIPRNHKDYQALRLFNHLFGGDSFNSILTKNIRTKNGWAYAAYSMLMADRYQGSINMFVQTANVNIHNVLNEINRLLDNPKEFITQRNLDMAKRSLSNRYVFLFDSMDYYLDYWLRAKWDGLPDDYLASLPQKTQKLTLNQVLQAGKRYFNANRFHLTLVGPEKLAKEKNFRFGSEVQIMAVPK